MMGDNNDRAAGAVLGVGNKSQLFSCHWAAEKWLLFHLFPSELGFFFPQSKRHQVALLFFTHEIHTITRIFLVNLCPNRPFSSCWEMMFGLQLPFAASCRRASARTKLRGEAAGSPPTVNLFICSYSNHIFYYLYEIHCVIHFAGAANASRKALKNILFRNNFFCSHQGRVSFSGLSFLPAFSLAACVCYLQDK